MSGEENKKSVKMQNKLIQGLGTALITPFLMNNQVDYPSLSEIIERQIQGGVDFLVVLGTTAEAATMTWDERLAVSRFVLNQVHGRIPLVIGWGSNNTLDLIQQFRDYPEYAEGYDAILSVCPYYNKPSQEGLYAHFTMVAQAAPLPLILYNVPGRTGVNLLPETVMRIWRGCPDRILAIKEASGKPDQIKELIDLSRAAGLDGFVLSGDDNLAAPLMAAGASGLISVASNALPELMGKVVRQADMECQEKLDEFIRLLFIEGNPAGIKTVLSEMGLIYNVLRLPLVPNSPMIQQAIRTQAHTFGLV